jgi:hypothetical protein
MKRITIFVMALMLVLSLAGCARSDFNQTVDLQNLQQAMGARGLQPCAEDDLKWSAVPGFVEGKRYDVDQNCAAYDPNFPGARVFLANSIRSRRGMQRCATSRRSNSAAARGLRARSGRGSSWWMAIRR